MKRFLAIAICMVICLCTLVIQAFGAGELVEASQNKPFYMTVLGDSIAAGYGLEGYEKDPCYTCKSYANILAEKYGLTAQGTYHNYAVSGYTSDDLLNLLDNREYQPYIKNSDLIIISIGGNDMLHVFYDALEQAFGTAISEIKSIEDLKSKLNISTLMTLSDSLEANMSAALAKFDKNLKLINKKLRAMNPSSLIIVQTIYNPFESFEEIELIKSLSESTIADFNKVITDSSTDDKGGQQYIVSDVAASFKGKSNELTNINALDIHPSAKGHEAIAKLLDDEITSHTFTSWVIDTNTDDEASSKADAEADRWRNVMAGFFVMLLIVLAMIGVIFIKKMREL